MPLDATPRQTHRHALALQLTRRATLHHPRHCRRELPQMYAPPGASLPASAEPHCDLRSQLLAYSTPLPWRGSERPLGQRPLPQPWCSRP